MNLRQLLSTFIGTATAFGATMLLIFAFQFGQGWGVFAGVTSGVLFGFLPNLLRIIVASGSTQTFVVRDQKKWIQQLTRATVRN
jgi:ABC-type antimicrobial peptide transport system permease subunit